MFEVATKDVGALEKSRIGSHDLGHPSQEASYIPPDPAKLRQPLDNWEKYYHADRPDLLVQLAMVHGQFELIHPFIDGNGRLGRILIPLFLFERGLLSRPVFYLSAYIEEHQDEYISGLSALSSKPGTEAWNDWVRFFLKAVSEQAQKNLNAARSIIDLYERSKAEIIGLTHSQFAVPLLDILFDRPVFSPSQLEGRTGMPSKQMTMSLIGKLRDAGILIVTREPSGRRAQILAFAELVNLCEGREVFRIPKSRKQPAKLRFKSAPASRA